MGSNGVQIREVPLYIVAMHHTVSGQPQWNLSKANTNGINKIVHYREGVLWSGVCYCYIWDSVSVHYREGVLWRGVSAKRGSTLDKLLLLEIFWLSDVYVF